MEILEVRGAEYPPQPEKVQMAQLVSWAQMALFALIFVGDSLFSSLKLAVPAPLRTVQDNKLASFMVILLLGNTVQSSILSTGAFEIYHGDELIWSSLEAKRLPNMQDLVQAFAKTGVEFLQKRSRGPEM